MAATGKQWYVREDGCISIGESASTVTYHSALNSIIVSTTEPSVKIYDVASGALLQKSNLAAQPSDTIKCLYLPETDKVVFCDESALGARSDMRGMLLLDTALQSSVANPDDAVKVEIPLAEAGQLLKSLVSAELPGVDHVEDVVRELEKKIDVTQEATKGHLKTAKWATVCLELPLSRLKSVCSGLVVEMKRLSLYNPGLAVASAVSDRLSYLLPSPAVEAGNGPVERSMMYSEVTRQKTFRKWPHMNYKWALPDPMAQAGFYHQPNTVGDDRAMCFTCNVCLVCWEPTDEPWSEHERHSPACPFVKGEYTQNVPLCVTFGSQPAKRHGEKKDKIECLSTTAVEEFVATSTANGNIVVWNVSKLVKKHCQFNLDPTEPAIAVKTGFQIERSVGKEILADSVEQQVPVEVENRSTIDARVAPLVNGSNDDTPSSSVPVTEPQSHDSVYELPQNKSDKTEGVKTRSRPCDDIQVKSLCLVRKPVSDRLTSEKDCTRGKPSKKGRSKPQPTLFCGASLRRTKLSVSNREEVQCNSRTEEVQLMNIVNESVSSDSHSRIISPETEEELGEISLQQDELLDSTTFIPHLLVVAVKEDHRKHSKHKEKESKPQMKPSTSIGNLNAVPMLGSITSNHEWGILDPVFDSDPDPDVQIVGVTPGPISLSGENPYLLGDKYLTESQTQPIQSSVSNLQSSESTVTPTSGSSKPVSTKPKAGTVLQCVELPVDLQHERLYVSGISPTLDGQHLVVVVSPIKKAVISDSYSTSKPVISDSIVNNHTEVENDCVESADKNSVSSGAESESQDSVSHKDDLVHKGGCILIYRYKFSSSGYAVLEETPILTKYLSSADSAVTSVLILQQDFSDYEEEEGQKTVSCSSSTEAQKGKSSQTVDIRGQIAVTLQSGKLWLLNLCDLNEVAEITPPKAGEKFVSSAYCTGMERLCVCSADGRLHFYQLCEEGPIQTDVESPIDSTDGVFNGDGLHEPEACTSSVDMADGREHLEKNSPGSDILAKKPLTVENLMILHNLIQFENLMPRFTATVPPCWTEIQQEQQQRRHPQHLQHQGEATQHTRTWKLQPDSNTWDEHLIEIVLPRPCCVGHVDVKFTLHPMCTSPPDVQVTLLKQNITSIGRQTGSSSSVDVDQGIDFKMNSSEPELISGNVGIKQNGFSERVNNVLDPLFQDSHNAEILCGPVNISSCLDLSGNSGLITLTSPQLLSSKPKAFLLHVKGFPSKNDEKNNEKQKELKKKAATPAPSSAQKMKVMKTAFDNDLFIPPSKVKEAMTSSIPRPKYPENLKGCDWIQELSVTIRKTKKIQLPKERLQRNAMIDHVKFHERLLSAVSLEDGYVFNGVSADHYQNMGLDILMWISAVQMNDPAKRSFSKSLPASVKPRLEDIIKSCFIQGTRTTAHKCGRLLAFCMEQCKQSADPDIAPNFSYSLLYALMETLPLLPCANFAGSVRWFFNMLNRVKCMDVGKVSHLCTDLLMKTSKHYNDRNSGLHALLKSRFGLYGQPFDSDLFDTDLPLALRQTVPSLSYTSAQSSSSSSTSGNNNNNTSSTSVADELDCYDLFNPPSEKSSKIQLEYAKSSLFGLLEVEPLHFSCHSTSDGTKMERMDTNTGGHLPPSGLSGTINFGEGIPPQPGPGTTTATFPPLSSTLAMPKQHLHELTTKSYPTFKHKMMHIKLYLSEMRKMLPVESASKHSSSSDHLLPPTPKTTPQVMTPPLTPPNEWQQNQGSSSGNSDTKGDNSKQFSAHSTLGSLANAQTLLQQPPLQVLVIERMHSGARRFVILDFGKPVVLTDVVIPACADLASLSIDVWVQGEEVDGQRFVVASDIGVRSLIMNDIMPALVCRYLKITTIGRYGSGSSRSKIPIGAFYGHSCILPWEWNSYLEQCCSHTVGSQTELPTQSHLLAQLGIYMSLLEDIQCRYSLAKTRLESLLTVLDSQQYASAHVQYYLKRNKKHLDEDNKIIQAYHDCLQLQLQLNLAQRATNRLHNALGFKVTHTDYGTSLSSRLRQACSDKLRFIQECLLEVLLSITTSSPSIPQPPMSLFNILSPHTSELLFKNLCVHGTKKIQISTGMLLMRVCGSQPWWGNFLGNVLQEFFHSENTQIFSQDRVFVLLLAMGQKALSGPCAVPIMESLLDMLARVLSPLISGQRATLYSQSGLIDLTLVGWILLFLCRNLDHTTLNSDDSSKAARKERDNGNMLPNRWNFIQGDHNSTTAAAVNAKSKASKLCRGSRLSMQKRLLHHKQKLMDLQQAQKTFFSSHMEKSSQNSTNALLKQQEKEFRKELSKYASKHIKDIIQMRRTEVEMLRKMTKSESGSDSDKSSSEDDQDIGLVLPKDKTLRVVKGLMALLLNMDFTCNVDLFLVTCKVLATICVTTRPAITLAEAMSQEQLERLILLASNVEFSHGNVSWGGPWAGHAVTSLLQDILDGEKFYPANASSCTEVSSEDVMGFGAETDDSLPKSISLPVLEETGDQEPSSLEKPEIDASDSKDDSTKMNFEKESSLMVDLLLDDGEFDDDTSAKLHAYVTGESVKPPPPPSDQILYENGLPSSSLNGTLEMANYVDLEQEKKKNIFKKLAEKISDAQGKDSWVPVNSLAFRNSLVAQGMSTAVDARLEFGLETQAELRLKVMMSLHTEAVQQAFSCPLPAAPSLSHSMEQMVPPSTDDELSEANSYLTQSEITSSMMLSQCYEALFSHLPPHCTNLDTLLHLWLTLNGEGNTDGNTTPVTFDPTRIPLIPLSQSSVSNLLSVLSSMPSIPICTWVLAFQTLTLLANQKIPSQNGAPDVPMVVVMLADTNLITVIKKFLSGTSDHGPVASAVQFTQIGPSATKSFQEFLLRLLVKCSPDSLPKLKELMLKLVYTLSAERGAFHCGLGPLDAQCKFLDFILDNTYEQVDISNAISVIESISSLVHQHIQCQERISCRSSSENNINARSCFGGLFTSLLRGNDSRSSGDASRDTLMCSLLRLINKLIQTRCNTVRTTRMVSIGLDTSTTTEPHTPTNISMSEPVPDSTKLVQALATSTPTSTVRLSDEEKSQQTDEQKTENLNTQSDMMGTYIADIILGHQQIMCNLIQALSYCNSNTMAMMLGSRGMSSHIQDTFTGSEPISVGDGIYQILVTLTRHCSDQKLVLESLFHYLSGSYQMAPSHSISRLSEPLLWFVLKVLDSARVISVFLEMGGIQVLCRNLVNCNCRIISTNPSLISTIMHNLNGKSRSTDKKVYGLDSDSSDGLQNFAPLGSITSSSPTASPAEVLIQASPPHRRARSAAWSYHFYPDEAWVDLTIQLPFAILLKEVQIQPHSASLTTCPAYVSLEISHDCVTTTPLCQPLSTSSLAFIKLQLQRPDIATTVTIRLHKARDSMTIGLSQVLLMGYSTFGDTGHVSHNIFMPNEDFVSKSGVRWIRLLHHCLTAHKEVEEAVATAAAPTANLLNTCSALLVSPVSSIYVPNIEEVLLKLGLHSVDMGLVLMDSILRSSQPQTHSGVASPYLGKVSGHANDSTVELLHQLGTVQDQGTYQRVQALLQWVHDSAKMALQKSSVYVDDNYRQRDSPYLSLPSPAPSHIQCVSGVLWRSHELPVEYNLRSLITKELVSSMYEWSTILKVDSNLKKAVDYVLCAMCHIDPEYFSQILVWMGIMVSGDNSMSASISDDRKDNSQPYQGSMTDDSKEASNVHGQQSRAGNHVTEVPPVMLQDFTHLSLEESHLSTLSFTCKSPVAIKQLLYSGFPAVLAQGLFEFCNKVINRCSESYVQSEGLTDSYKTRCEEGVPSFTTTVTSPTPEDSEDKALWITADRVASVLHFLAEVSTEPLMKDWLGGPEGNIFWPAMLTMLCNTPVQTSALANNTRVQEIMSMENRACIETAAVHFFTQVMSCHSINQLLFAKVLCEVIKEQTSSTKAGQSLGNFPLSGFTRCLFLQALLEDEKILVVLRSANQQSRGSSTARISNPVQHPRHSGGRGTQTMVVSLHSTIADIKNKVTDLPSLPGQFLEKAAEKSDETKKDMENYTEMADYLSSSMVAGHAAKEKRDKEDKASGKSSLPPRPPTRRGRLTADNMTSSLHIPVTMLSHALMPNSVLPGELTLSQLLQVLHQRGLQHGQGVLEFTIHQDTKKSDSKLSDQTQADSWEDTGEESESLLSMSPFPTALQVFASVGGLALLAEHLPLLYPEMSRQPSVQEIHAEKFCKTMSNSTEDWVTVEQYPEEFYEHYELLSPAPNSSKTTSPAVAMPTIPPHSLVAFGLFLRLPGYAEVLLKERKKAQCLLRLVLGVTDDGDGGHILTSPIACSLPTLPFLVLKSLYDTTPLTTDDGVLLRRMSLDIWAIHLILACLSVLSHHAPRVPVQGFQQEAQMILSAMQSANVTPSVPVNTQTEEKSQQYWAKGTGFGTGSTTSSWDAEQALLRQKSEEEHVACLLQVLASYINPGGEVPKDFDSETFTWSSEKSLLPEVITELLSQSCLVPAISSYLRNDSVLDMARHIPLYRSLLELLRGLAVCPSLVPLLLPLDKENNPDSSASVGLLLDKMRGCVDTYASRLKSNKGKNGGSNGVDEEENEGLAMLIPNIQDTAKTVKLSTDRLQKSVAESERSSDKDGPQAKLNLKKTSAEERYMMMMKELQFDTFEFVIDDNGIKFACPHHYENNVKAAGDINNAARTRRLAQEAVTLSTSLPLSAGSSVFVRCDEERLDIMKVLITGPSDTPYDNGCFEFDVYFPQDYPNSPPFINLETTGNHTIRFNPNLYNDGKVCLSVLNTWHGRPEEKWNAQTSSFLQVLVSIQSLILVSEPYFNEPGYERSRGTPSGTASSREYDANIRQATVKWAMLEQLRNPSACLKEVVHKHFWLKRHEILRQCESWIAEMEGYCSDKRTGRAIAHSTLALKRHYNQLREELAKLKTPEGLEDSDSEETIDPKGVHFSTDSSLSSSLNNQDPVVAGPSTQVDTTLMTDVNSNSF